MRLLAKTFDRIDISSIALSALSAKGCAQAHSMPKIHMYRSSDERKYHSACTDGSSLAIEPVHLECSMCPYHLNAVTFL